jgi:hypothetical protein
MGDVDRIRDNDERRVAVLALQVWAHGESPETSVVVVPALRPITDPWAIRSAAARPIWRLSSA